MMFRISLLSLILLLPVDGFHPVVSSNDKHQFARFAKRRGKSTANKDIVPSTKDNNPFREVDIDLEKAKDVVNHFGRHSVQEIEKIRDDLHAHRVQSLVFGVDSITGAVPDEMFQEKILEDELNLQLHLLQETTPDPYLFTTAEEKQKQEPKVDDSTTTMLSDGTTAMTASEQHLKEEEQIAFFEEMAEEGVLESLAMCAVVGLVMFLPQFMAQ